MTLPFVIPYRDFTALPRQRWFYTKRLGFLLPLAAVLLVTLVFAASTGFSSGGLGVFGTFTGWLHTMVFLYAALAAASDVMREKEERTLGLLALTDLTAGLQVAGRLLSGLGFMLLALGSAFPLLVLSAALGGVSTGQVAAALAVLTARALLGTALGLAASLAAANERRMLLRLGLGAAGLWVLAWLAGSAASGLGLGRAVTGSALHVITAGAAGTLAPCLAWVIATHVPAALALLAWAWAGLRRHVALEGVGAAAAAPRRFTIFRRPRGRLPPVSANPMMWKDLNLAYGGLRGEWLGCAALAALVAGITLATALLAGAPASEGAGAAGLALGLAFGVALAGLSLYRAARSFQAERQQGALALLLLTDLTEWRIIRGKLAALALAGLPWASVAAAGGLLAWVGFGMEWEPLFVGAGGALFLAGEAILFACLAMRLSLSLKLPATLAVCGVAFLAWNTCIRNVLTMPFLMLAAFLSAAGSGSPFSFGAMFLPGYALDGLAAFLMVQQLHGRLRVLARGGLAC